MDAGGLPPPSPTPGVTLPEATTRNEKQFSFIPCSHRALSAFRTLRSPSLRRGPRPPYNKSYYSATRYTARGSDTRDLFKRYPPIPHNQKPFDYLEEVFHFHGHGPLPLFTNSNSQIPCCRSPIVQFTLFQSKLFLIFT